MIQSESFLQACREFGLTTFTGTPCSYLKPFINYVIDSSDLKFYGTTNEGDAVAFASGCWMSGKTAVVMFQNSGLGNAVNPITSLSYSSKIPFLGITTWRGEPGGKKDEPQHELMGRITPKLLDTMEVKWSFFPEKEDEVFSALQTARTYMEETRSPYFFVMKEGSVNAYELQNKSKRSMPAQYKTEIQRLCTSDMDMIRTQALQVLEEEFGSDTAFVATTGKTGREFFELGDKKNKFYMVGSMGCALPIGLGVTHTNPKRKVCVIDGDGALLMRLGNMALPKTWGSENLVHIVLDNQSHDSTGGQDTGSEKIDLCEVAKACGYPRVVELSTESKFREEIKMIKNEKTLTFMRVMIKKGSPEKLGRPTVTPEEVALRFHHFLKDGE